ncbi:MAG: LssY C-terminal domain-containing protein [Parvibaculaceae bacterium]
MPLFRRRVRCLLLGAVVLASAYALLAYVVMPLAWSHYEHQTRLQNLPMVTRTAQDIPGDPLNIGLVGAKEDIAFAMQAAGWSPADKLTWRSSIAIVGSVILDRGYKDAPVSPLFLAGRPEDLAYEKEDGASADRRHHVRLWQVLATGAEARPVWLGAATFDTGVGLSRYTGQFTHHIAADIDAERDDLGADLVKAGMVTTTYQVSGIGPTLFGRNGGGDRYYTDGEVHVMVLTARGAVNPKPPAELPDPPIVALKDGLWRSAREATGLD